MSIAKANVLGTIGSFEINGQQWEMDYKWIYEDQEAETLAFRVDGNEIHLDSVEGWIKDSMFEEVPYNELLDPEY